MSIVPMQRVVLCGMAHERDAVLKVLQQVGCLHLIPLKASQPLEPEADPRRRRATAAFQHLADAPVMRRPWPARRQID
ncbi:MAG: V-type ATP synthase subunit I, partial [Pseudomonadota bacterium]